MSCPSTARVPRRPGLASPTLFALILLVSPGARAAGPPSIAGHWTGTLRVGGTPLALDVDFTQKAGGWAGDISIPAQGAQDLPLQGVTIEGDQVAFTLTDVPGHPSYKGRLAPDGSSIKGTFTQAGKELELALKRAADPVAAMKKSLEGFDAVVDKAIKDFKVPGLAIAIVKDGQVIYA